VGSSGSAMVRAPTRDELRRAAEIGKIAFEDHDLDSWVNSYEWLADNRGLEYVVVVEADGEIVSSLLCTPGEAMFRDDVVALSAVGGVATLPEHRKKGYAGMMMREAVRILHRNGWHTSALWPFSYNYYRKFGWEVGSEHRMYAVPSEVARGLAAPDGVRPATESDLPEMSRVADRFARRYNCVTVHDDLWWNCILATHRFRFDGDSNPKTSHCPWVHESDGKIDGYAIFEVRGEGEQTSVEATEIAADTAHARRAILSRLAETGAQTLTFYAPLDDGFRQELPDPDLVKTEMHSGFQFRVVNPPAALELRTADPGVKGRIGFQVSDPVLGGFEFDVEVGDGRISRAKSSASKRLSMDVQTFSQLYCGYVRPARAAELGRLAATSAGAVEFAERLFPDAVPFRSLVELG